MAPLNNSWESARAWWQTAAPTTRAAATAAMLLLIIGLVVAASISASPDYTVIYRGVSGKDPDAIQKVLAAHNIPFKYDADSQSFSVPSKDKSNAIMYVGAEASLSKDAEIPGIELLNQDSMSTTPEVEKERIRAANQGEVDHIIMNVDGVQTAHVETSGGSASSLFDNDSPAKASVMLSMKPGQALDDEAVKGIVTLVANAFTGLTPNNVSLIDQTGRTLWPTDQAANDPGAKRNGQFAEAERKRLQDLLDVAFPGKTKVTVQTQLDFDQSQIHETDHLPAPGNASSLPLSTMEDDESLSGSAVSAPGGIAGAASNTGAPSYTASGAAGSPSNYKHSKVTTNYTDNVRDTITQKAPGDIQKETVAALVDSSLPADVVTGIQKTLTGAVGALPGDNIHLITVQQMPFDNSAARLAQAQFTSTQSQQLWSNVAKGMAAVVVAAVLLFLLTRSGRRGAAPQLATAGEGANIGLLDREALPGTVEEAMLEERPLRIEDVLAEMPDIMPGSRPRRRPHAPAIEEQPDLKLESVQEMISASPQSVALLLKGWMYEESRAN